MSTRSAAAKSGPSAKAKRHFRQFQRLVQRDGDHCHGCRRQLQDGETGYVGYDRRRRFVIVGKCCAHYLIEPTGVSIGFTPSPPASPWIEDDRSWFEANPRRSHRLRRAYPGEWPDAKLTHTVMRQLQPGARQRTPVTLTDLMPREGEAPEGAAWAIYDLAIEGRKSGRHGIPVTEIFEAWAVRENEGCA